ncbi:MAG: amino acid adenylation domain-containing protein [Blastocatellia bacterium]|nr:amino acid adenylation domain-containing protein [Blastocatellia bacterium]
MTSEKITIEAIYPLSPLQQGLLFHSVTNPQSGDYTGQFTCRFEGNLNAGALKRAWQMIIERHSVFRTLFKADREDEPIQVVCKHVKLPWEEQDWRTIPEPEQQRLMEDFLKADSAHAFEFTRPPLMRLTLIRLADEAYQFIWSHHHIMLDGWSEALVSKELMEFYHAVSNGLDLQTEPAHSYAGYITWLKRQDMLKAESFWREMLKGFSSPTPLGLAHSPARPADAPQGFGERHIHLSAQTSAQLYSLIRKHQITVNTLMQGCWALLLGRYSSEEDVVFGNVVSGRPPDLAGVETMVGLFLNTLPVRVRLSDDALLMPWLREIQKQQVEARQYEYSPLVDIHRWSGLPRGMPLFESIFVFENYPEYAPSEGPPGEVRMLGVRDTGHTGFPLTLIIRPGRQLLLTIEYDRRRFSDAAIDCMLAHFDALLESIAEDPGRQLSSLSMLTEAERQRFLVEWNDTTEPAREQMIHMLFEEQAAARPQATALSFQGETISYQELNARSNRLAHGLIELGARPNQAVALILDDGFDQVVSLLGVLKSGSAFLCLDRTYPAARLKYILEEINPPCLICDAKAMSAHGLLFREFALDSQCRIIILEDKKSLDDLSDFSDKKYDSRWLNDFPATGTDSAVTSTDLAYIVYTSGSTGKPKGILQSHGSFCQFIGWQARQFDVRPGKRTGKWASVTYDASYAEIFGTLCLGATLCIGTADVRSDPLVVVKWARQDRLSLLQTVPSFCRQILLALQSDENDDPLPDLETMLVAGEVLPVALAGDWLERFPLRPRLFNLYGPTESILATLYEVKPGDGARTIIPVGRAIGGRQILVLDSEKRLCPTGVKGEVYIRSPYLTDGYFQRPKETESAYLQNPLHDMYSDRVYRTGDLGRWMADSNLEFCGRIDNQVKIRGKRVELEEIESMLSGHQAVSECALILQDQGDGDQRLIAYVATSSAVSSSALKGFLSDRLPDYMIPSAILFLDNLPRTHSGKIDRLSLPDPDHQRPEVSRGFVAPRTPMERLIAEIWQQVLQVEGVGVFDDFFELGGHSLLTTQMLNKLRQTCGVEYPAASFFDAPTVAALASGIEAMQADQEETEKIRRIMEQVSKLPDEEVRALLRQKKELSESSKA